MKKGNYLFQVREELLKLKKSPLDEQEKIDKSIELATLIQKESELHIKPQEKAAILRLSRMMNDPKGKAFSTSISDQCFRSNNTHRIASLLHSLSKQYGTPKFFLFLDKLKWYGLKLFSKVTPGFTIQLFKEALKQEMSAVVLPGEYEELKEHIQRRIDQKILVNLNRLGEAVLGEKEANHRLQQSLDDLKNPKIDYISIKGSNIFSQIHLVAWDQSKEEIKLRLRELYQAAIDNKITDASGKTRLKFVNLDMEEYRDLDLTVDAFIDVLSEEPFKKLSAGIVLQSYLPDSFPIQEKLTEWAKDRASNGGAPIKIRIVKGANLAMERVEASIMEWPQAPYLSKEDVDANFKKMLLYGCQKENIEAVHLGIGSHNLFDISLALILCYEGNLEEFLTLEMLEGMSPHTRRVIAEIAPSILLYCPASKQHEFHNAISYLIRRLDENTGEDNFLRYSLTLDLDPEIWKDQANRFASSYKKSKDLFCGPSRTQNRQEQTWSLGDQVFQNCPNTDWSLKQNRAWGNAIIDTWVDKKLEQVPLCIGNEETLTKEIAIGDDPSTPHKELYTYSLASFEQVSQAIDTAHAFESTWKKDFTSLERKKLLKQVAIELEKSRFDLMGACMMDGGKILTESDPEVSEAVDFANYYADSIDTFADKERSGITITPRGTTLVISPWNFPCAIPVGGIASALSAGNCVIFKPASATTYIGWLLAQCFWRAGVPKEALQFVQCQDAKARNLLLTDKRISQVTLTGGTQTAESILSLRPNLRLNAETGGKNAMIVTDLADQDLAIKDMVQSAFGHSGQKCSAASLGVLLEEVYDNPSFLEQLQDATMSLKVGPAYDPKTKVGPLITAPKGALLDGLSRLEQKEKWLVKPSQVGENPNLWSPGIKMNIANGSKAHLVEFFGPLLSLYRTPSLKKAVQFVNQTSYGLTSGLQSLDAREHKYWTKHIQAGNCYINREITGAIVQRQPFGGWKASSFGAGIKAGGPNYVLQFLKCSQVALPTEQAPFPEKIEGLSSQLEKILSSADYSIWKKSVSNYVFAWNELKARKDASELLGQDNFLEYVPIERICLRIQDEKNLLDTYRILAILLLVSNKPFVSICPKLKICSTLKRSLPFPGFKISSEDERTFIDKIKDRTYSRLRFITRASENFYIAAKESHTSIIDTNVLAYGRVELLHYLKERSLSVNYHRYGNLGFREKERRKAICPPSYQT